MNLFASDYNIRDSATIIEAQNGAGTCQENALSSWSFRKGRLLSALSMEKLRSSRISLECLVRSPPPSSASLTLSLTQALLMEWGGEKKFLSRDGEVGEERG